jgi:uncharacterized protein
MLSRHLYNTFKKRILLLNIFVFLGSGIILGQENRDIKDGYQVFKYPNGNKSGEGLIKNGLPDGYWKNYYVTGVKMSEGKRTNFLLDSIWIFYDQVGDTLEKINYLVGKKNGYYYKYKKDPTAGNYIWSKELFAGDKKEGTAYIYFPNGKIQQTITYNEGKKEGLSREFDGAGRIISLLEYNNDFLVTRERINRVDNKGLKQGEWKDFYSNWSVKSERSYKDDMLHGYYKEYDEKGKLILTMLYENGTVAKSSVEDNTDIQIVNKRDSQGKLIYSGPYRNNTPVGIHREYDKDGKVTNAYSYADNGIKVSEGIVDEAGNKNGKWKDFFPNGKVQAEGQYTDNKRTGIWKFYNSAEKVEQTGSFNNGSQMDFGNGITKMVHCLKKKSISRDKEME